MKSVIKGIRRTVLVDDLLQIATILVKYGYRVRVTSQTVNGRKETVLEYDDD